MCPHSCALPCPGAEQNGSRTGSHGWHALRSGRLPVEWRRWGQKEELIIFCRLVHRQEVIQIKGRNYLLKINPIWETFKLMVSRLHCNSFYRSVNFTKQIS